jgi:DNA-binding LytR/AlgR family response regulator
MVIFTTAFSNYALLGYELNVIDYLLKPIELNRFLTACEKASQQFNFINLIKNNAEPILIIKSNYQLIKIKIKDIIYVEAFDDYVKIHLNTRLTITTKLTMSVILKRIKNYGFVRVHRSFIVSKDMIASLSKNHIKIDERDIPVGKTFKKNILL